MLHISGLAGSFDDVDKSPHLGLVDQSTVHFANSGPPDHVAHIVLPDSAAGNDGDPIVRLIYQRRNDIDALQRGRSTSRGKYSAGTRFNRRLERRRQIRGRVDRSMERHRQSRCGFDESARTRDVDAAFRGERTGHDPSDAHASRPLNGANHFIELTLRVDEASRARSNQNEHRKPYSLGDGGNQSLVWCGAALVQILAQLDPVDTSSLGGERGIESLNGCLDENQLASSGSAASVSASISPDAHS